MGACGPQDDNILWTITYFGLNRCAVFGRFTFQTFAPVQMLIPVSGDRLGHALRNHGRADRLAIRSAQPELPRTSRTAASWKSRSRWPGMNRRARPAFTNRRRLDLARRSGADRDLKRFLLVPVYRESAPRHSLSGSEQKATISPALSIIPRTVDNLFSLALAGMTGVVNRLDLGGGESAVKNVNFVDKAGEQVFSSRKLSDRVIRPQNTSDGIIDVSRP